MQSVVIVTHRGGSRNQTTKDMKTTMTKKFDGKKFYYYFGNKLYRTSKNDYKYACIAITDEAIAKAHGTSCSEYGFEMVASLGNNIESTRKSMEFRYREYCRLEVINIVEA